MACMEHRGQQLLWSAGWIIIFDHGLGKKRKNLSEEELPGFREYWGPKAAELMNHVAPLGGPCLSRRGRLAGKSCWAMCGRDCHLKTTDAPRAVSLREHFKRGQKRGGLWQAWRQEELVNLNSGASQCGNGLPGGTLFFRFRTVRNYSGRPSGSGTQTSTWRDFPAKMRGSAGIFLPAFANLTRVCFSGTYGRRCVEERLQAGARIH